MSDSTAPRRAKIPEYVEATVLMRSGRRCCLCWHYDSDFKQKHGQIAHLDQDPANAAEDNLVFLCIPHHSDYDSITRQHKNYTEYEVRQLRNKLYAIYAPLDTVLKSSVHWQFSIEGSVREFNKDKVESLAVQLKYLLDDPLVRIEKIEQGSIVAQCESSLETFFRAAGIFATDELGSRVGKIVGPPQLTFDSAQHLIQNLYSILVSEIRDPATAAMAVEAFLTENGLAFPLAEMISPREFDTVNGQLGESFRAEYGNAEWQSVLRFPLHLRVVLMMAALNWSAVTMQESLGLCDLYQCSIYLVLGTSAWVEVQGQRAMTASG